MTLTVPCLFGLESLVADEMKRLQLNNIRAENGRVHCEGTELDIARLNINLRCGARVLMELGSFPVHTFDELFEGVCSLPWAHRTALRCSLPVKSVRGREEVSLSVAVSSQLLILPWLPFMDGDGSVQVLTVGYDLCRSTGTACTTI